MTFRVITSTRAEREMWETVDYISFELSSPQTALDLVEKIEQQIADLEFMPKRFMLVSDERLAQMGMRSVHVKNYSIFYVVDEQTATVTVISVMYGRRDWANLL